MSIGTTIKKLRRDRNMTQERLAEHLGLTANAISQWECDRTAPDISQLPLLAYVLDVTTDEILGVDSRKIEEEICTVLAEEEPLYAAGDFRAAAQILRKGLHRYPRSHRLMARLAHVLGCLGGCDSEVTALCEKVIAECTDNEIRDSAYQDLIFNHKNNGRREAAIAVAKRLSHAWVSREDMLMNLLQSEAARDNLVDYIKFCSGRLMLCFEALAEQTACTVEEKLALTEQTVALLELLYPHGDYHFYAQFGADACGRKAALCARSGDVEGALQALEQMVKYSVHFDTYSKEAENTSPAVRGYVDGGWIPMPDTTYCGDKLKWLIEGARFSAVREDPRFRAVTEQLSAAGK